MKYYLSFLKSQNRIGRLFHFLIIFLVGLVLISLLNFWQVVRPSRITIQGIPADYGLEAEDVNLTAADGVNIKGWYIPSTYKEDKSALILLHGYPAEKSDMLRLAERLHPNFSVLLMDLRYFGESGGRATTLGIKEPNDVQEAVKFLQEKDYEEIGIFGFSFGGAVALMTAAKEPGITAVGAYASYADLRQLGHDVFFVLPGVKYPLVELMNIWSGVFFGDFVLSESPQKLVQELNIPVLIIHSKQDEQIPFSHAQKLYKSLKQNEQAEFIFLEEGRHGVLPGNFEERLIDFFGGN